MAEEESAELKFRLSDGSDIGPNKVDGPKAVSDVKLICSGKILENERTLAESGLPVNEIPGGIITMHVVVRPPLPDKKSEKLQEDCLKKNRCSCSIL